ncbi:MAG TPA: high-affinity nickel-transport family protein [Verrucomicrobiae bacterium]|nr:high-affinity nickel-transport family protein [Verrucomicrobiae bacterium]
MSTPVSIVLLGFFLGMRHATDPDHVIAVTTIVARQRRVGAAALIGVLWGIGHTLTIIAVGGAVIVFGVVIPPRLGLTMELSVALMLILLGLLNLAGITRWITRTVTPVHVHPHQHGDDLHTRAHVHAADDAPLTRLDRRLGDLGLYQALRPLAVGVVHGLAGSAAVALLVLAAIPDPLWGIAYLIVFGVGTIAGMMLVTAASALPFAYTVNRFAAVNRHLVLASGVASIAFGLFLVYRIGVVDGLFSGPPG